MFFVASKLFWLVADPLTLALLVTCLGVALLAAGLARTGRWLAAAGAVALAALFLTPAGVAMIGPLEDRFALPPADLPAPAGIIVLGGGLNAATAQARGTPGLNADGERIIAGLDLARRYPSARLIFTGGSGDLFDQSSFEATEARKFWEEHGGPAERMVFEGRSRNTWENALFTRDLLHPKPGEKWLLVTSAVHMPRSIGIFRRLGFDVTAYPVAFRTLGDERDWSWLQPASARVPLVSAAAREWIGLVAYRLTDKTSALFPAP